MTFPFNADGSLASTTGTHGEKVPTQAALDAFDALVGGGGAITATDGTTTVNPATSIQFPAGTLADLGGGAAGVGLIWRAISADIAYDTPELNNPTNFGPAVLTIPAGSFFQVFALISTEWDADGTLELLVAADDSGNNTMAGNSAVYIPQGTTFTTPGDEGAIGEPTRSNNSTLTALSVEKGVARWNYAALDRVVCVGFYPAAGNPTQGEGKVVAIIATPAG